MINRDHFFASVREHFGSLNQSQVDGFGAILDGWERCNPSVAADPAKNLPAAYSGDRRWLAYILATVWHETACTMRPIEEIGHGRGRAYGHPVGPWHKVYDGRGDVQLTWQANYRHASVELAKHGVNVDLVQFPEKALDPAIAFAIMLYGMTDGWFTGKKLSGYFGKVMDDPFHARRIINGLDKAALIESYHHAFLKALS